MKILVVEDEQQLADSIKKGLEYHSFAVDTAYDGEAGLDFIFADEYDVIVLDRLLPKKNGMEVIKEMRQAKNHTPVLMLTAKTEVSDRVDGLQAGADDYLGKPFAFAELVARIQALSRRPKKRVGAVLQFEDLVVDTNSFSVKRGTVPIQLSRKEYALLEYLLKNKSTVVSADKITREVWSFDSDVLPNTAQVYIGYLRNKIDRAFPDLPPLIHTIRGFGYSLQLPRDKG